MAIYHICVGHLIRTTNGYSISAATKKAAQIHCDSLHLARDVAEPSLTIYFATLVLHHTKVRSISSIWQGQQFRTNNHSAL